MPKMDSRKDALTEERTSRIKFPFRLLVLTAAAVFISEYAVMLLLALFPRIPVSLQPLVDAAALTAILSPAIYLLWVRPFMHQLKEGRRSEAEIRQLSRRLINAEEVERKKLARDLHDEFGQAITALQLDVEALLRTCPPTDGARLPYDRIPVRMRKMGERIRDVTASLRPQVLDDFGIEAAIKWHIEEFLCESVELKVEFHSTGLKGRLPEEVETVLYRVCQEALNNVVKHADASKVTIWLTSSHPRVILTVRDDGTGFEMSGAGGDGIGLLGMRERVSAVGGTFRVVSEPKGGTVIRVELPIRGEGDSCARFAS